MFNLVAWTFSSLRVFHKLDSVDEEWTPMVVLKELTMLSYLNTF